MGPDRQAAAKSEIESMAWLRTRLCSSSNCVEVVASGNRVLIRDGKEIDGPILSFTPGEWPAFVTGIKAGDFDDVA
jgi:hypothetical protein